MKSPERFKKLLVTVGLCVTLGSGTLIKLKEDSAAFSSSTVLVGRIDNPTGWSGPVVVAAYTRKLGRISVAHETLLHEPGGYELIVP